MIVAVLDANVLASGFVGHGQTAPVQILDAWHAGSYALAVSEHLLTELAHTFEDPYFSRRLTPGQIAANLRLLEKRAMMATITVQVEGVATHQEDDLTLATAVSSGAGYLVTGDRKLQNVGTYQGVRIVSPRHFLEILQAQESGAST